MFELKPCPFCGGKAYLFVNDGVRVICEKCGATSKTVVDVFTGNGVSGNAVENTIKAWNRRTQEGGTHDEQRSDFAVCAA